MWGTPIVKGHNAQGIHGPKNIDVQFSNIMSFSANY